MRLLDKLLSKFLQPKAKEIEKVKEEIEKPARRLEQIDAELRAFRRDR